jgi:hypothetical protein
LSAINNIKSYFLKREIANKHSKIVRRRRFFNLNTAKSFGVLFDASDEAVYNKVSGFVRYLQSLNKNVKAIGIVEYKELPHYIMQKISFDYITSKDLTFSLKPNNVFVKDFLTSEFDILIDFNLNHNPVLVYILALSNARFKIGAYDEDLTEYYDFMLQGITEGDIAAFSKQLLFYLEELESETN